MIASKPRPERLAIGRRHVLYPVLAVIALVNLMFGRASEDMANDMPQDKTHPYFPDHFWPYPILAMAVLITLGLLAVAGQSVLQIGQPADPRAAAVPRPEWYFLALFQFVKLGPALATSILIPAALPKPEWYFLALFQFVKLGPALATSILIPAALVLGLLFWPLIDAWAGPKLARRLGWRSWPAPKRNGITRTIWFAGLGIIGVLTLWAALWPQLCVPWFFNGPVCGN